MLSKLSGNDDAMKPFFEWLIELGPSIVFLMIPQFNFSVEAVPLVLKLLLNYANFRSCNPNYVMPTLCVQFFEGTCFIAEPVVNLYAIRNREQNAGNHFLQVHVLSVISIVL